MNNSHYIFNILNETFCNDIHCLVNQTVAYETSDIVYNCLWDFRQLSVREVEF